MKHLFKIIIILAIGILSTKGVFAQANASLNLQTLNGGDIIVNGAGSLLITVGNTGPTAPIPIGKIRVQITVPTSISSTTGSCS